MCLLDLLKSSGVYYNFSFRFTLLLKLNIVLHASQENLFLSFRLNYCYKQLFVYKTSQNSSLRNHTRLDSLKSLVQMTGDSSIYWPIIRMSTTHCKVNHDLRRQVGPPGDCLEYSQGGSFQSLL